MVPSVHNCLTSFAQLHDVHLTITDSGLPRSKAKALEAIGARLWIAEVVKKVDFESSVGRHHERLDGRVAHKKRPVASS
jgi:hypothetical protein